VSEIEKVIMDGEAENRMLIMSISLWTFRLLSKYRVIHKTFVIMFMLQKINFSLLMVLTFIMSLVMVAINKTMDYFIFL